MLDKKNAAASLKSMLAGTTINPIKKVDIKFETNGTPNAKLSATLLSVTSKQLLQFFDISVPDNAEFEEYKVLITLSDNSQLISQSSNKIIEEVQNDKQVQQTQNTPNGNQNRNNFNKKNRR